MQTKEQKQRQETSDATLVVQKTDTFEQDLKKLDVQQQQKVLEKIDWIIELFENGHLDSFYGSLSKMKIPALVKYNPSIYSIRISRQIRALVFFEDDPIFQQKILTFLRLVLHENLEKALGGLVESYYQKELLAVENTDNVQ